MLPALLTSLRPALGRVRRRFQALPPPGWRGLPPRRFHAIGLGTPKSGTMSLAGIFADRYRAGHEVEWGPTIDLLLGFARGAINDVDMVRELVRRDRRLQLEFEASCFLAQCPGLLAAAFPETKFILTIRHCRDWLDSILDNNMRYRRSHDRYTAGWHDVLFQPHQFSYAGLDSPLADRGLYPLDAYITCWVATHERVIREVPADRLLIVRTDEIGARLGDIAAFLGLDTATLDQSRSHLNVTSHRLGMVDLLDADYVDARIQALDRAGLHQRYLS